jgi:hypothetical protein
MTKPSYEEAELKKLAETVLDKYRLEEVYSRPDQIDAAETRFYAAATPRAILDLLAELARVRGLLQRTTAIVQEFRDCQKESEEIDKLCVDVLAPPPEWDKRTTLNLKRRIDVEDKADDLLAERGAESADIGKLDTADKSGVEMGKVNRVEEL